ncbi:MAG: hypothetical protein NC218_03665 [Acetobacter sp.]|nr:hypothetical protein [Acetobacter sp.]
MSANNQLITASLAGTYFCWVETAEECCGDEGGIRRLSIYDTGCYRAKTAEEAMKQAINAYGPTEYGEYRARGGKTFLADGTPVVITELYKLHKQEQKRQRKHQEKATCAKKEQVGLEQRVQELERSNKQLRSMMLNQHQINSGLAKACEELATTCQTLHDWLTVHTIGVTADEKGRLIKQFFEEEIKNKSKK